METIRTEIQIMSFPPLQDVYSIVKMLGYNWAPYEDFPSIVIEHAPHGTVDSYLKTRGKPVTLQAWAVIHGLCVDVAVGIEALHANGIIHGDIKPQNILVYEDQITDSDIRPTARLSDFGHSIFSIEEEQRLSYLGTPLFNPPEVLDLRYGTRASQLPNIQSLAKCDVWGFGLTVWCFLKCSETFFDKEWMSAEEVRGLEQSKFLWQRGPDFLQARVVSEFSDPARYVSLSGDLRDTFEHTLKSCLKGMNVERLAMADVARLLDKER